MNIEVDVLEYEKLKLAAAKWFWWTESIKVAEIDSYTNFYWCDGFCKERREVGVVREGSVRRVISCCDSCVEPGMLPANRRRVDLNPTTGHLVVN